MVAHDNIASDADEVERLRAAIEVALGDLTNAHVESTHGLTASAAFIDRCVLRAIDALAKATT